MAISRWHSPKRYECNHQACPGEAVILAGKDAHIFVDRKDVNTTKAHNCCGSH